MEVHFFQGADDVVGCYHYHRAIEIPRPIIQNVILNSRILEMENKCSSLQIQDQDPLLYPLYIGEYRRERRNHNGSLWRKKMPAQWISLTQTDHDVAPSYDEPQHLVYGIVSSSPMSLWYWISMES
ncbi:hypothetical protein ACLB2K_004067 [Fragaria x ananassa]